MKEFTVTNLKESESLFYNDADKWQDMEPECIIGQMMEDASQATYNQAMQEPEFREQFFAQAEVSSKQSSQSSETQVIADELNKMGEGDEMSVALEGSVSVTGKEVSAKVAASVTKVDDGYEVSLEKSVGLKLVAEMGAGSKSKFGAKAQFSAGIQGDGKITIKFPNANEVDKAIKYAGKLALTSTLVGSNAMINPTFSFAIAKLGTKTPLIGKYLVDMDHKPDIDCQLKSIELTDSLKFEAGGSLDAKVPIKGLESLAKISGSGNTEISAKMGAKITFDDNGNPTLVLRAGANMQGNVNSKGGIGKYNSMMSAKVNGSASRDVWLEYQFPINKDQLAAFNTNPIGAVKNILKEATTQHKTVLKLNTNEENIKTKLGYEGTLTIEPEKLGDLLSSDWIKEFLADGDLEAVKKYFDAKGIKSNLESEDYKFCGKNVSGEWGKKNIADVELGMEQKNKDVGELNICVE